MFDSGQIFSPEAAKRQLAHWLYETISHLSLICPHHHLDPCLLAAENASLGTPAGLFILSDNDVSHTLNSQGFMLEQSWIPRSDDSPRESEHRKMRQIWAKNYRHIHVVPKELWQINCGHCSESETNIIEMAFNRSVITSRPN